MSTIKLNGTTSGSSIIKAPDSGSTNQTFTLPASSGTLVTTTDAGVAGITSAADATAITIDSSENVGIGNTTPKSWDASATALQLGTEAALVDYSGQTWLAQNYYFDGAHKYITTDEASRYRQYGGNHSFEVAASGSADAAISWANALEITNDGRGLSQFTAKVWCNFDGTGTAAIRDSHNVSSITDNGTGDFSVTFSNDMGNTNYCTSIGNYRSTGDTGIGGSNIMAIATGSIRFETVRDASTKMNPNFCNLLVFGD
jgi:hypothetical protein